MKLWLSGRRAGKTTKLAEWVKEGKRIQAYPYWDRVILTANTAQAKWLREHFKLDHRQVFVIVDWRGAQGLHKDVQVSIDNIDELIRTWAGMGHRVAHVTMNMSPVDSYEWMSSPGEEES
jgi:hypothetical protein